MFKRLMILFLCAALTGCSHLIANRSVFYGYTDTVEIYIGDRGSASYITEVAVRDYPFIRGACGQSFKTDLCDFNLKDFLAEFDAKIMVVETIAEGVSYYAYSPKIKFYERVGGKTVNLQIFIGNTVTVGTPLIYGSF